MLWRNKRYRFGVVAQFSNVAAQVCTWTFLIQYVEQALGGSLEKGGAYLQASLLVFLVSRFLMTWVIGYIRATKVLAVLAFLAVGLCLFAMSSPNMAGVIAVVSLSFCLSLMFPTIYGVALTGLGPATKFGAAGLVMAIVGGAIMPLVQGKLVDATSAAFSFIVPAGCFAVVGLYALYDLRAEPSVTGGEPVRDARPAPRPACAARRRRGVTARRRLAAAAAVAALALALGACGDDSPTSATTSTKQLEVVSWWTSGSEAAALNALFAAFRASNPGVDAVNGAVAGRRRLQRDRRARQAPAARRPARRLADVRRQVGPGLREPRRGPQRRVGLRQRAICARG